MEKNEKKLIRIIITLIIILILILIYIINKKPDYDKQLYNEIYEEYSNIFEKDSVVSPKKEKIYLEENVNGKEYRVIGKLYISKMRINTPVIYETTDELLKIAPAKLCGPNPNEVGNFCIVGHNYKNEQFFSNLSTLEKGDEIVFANNERIEKTYKVYDIFEVYENDLSCLDQNTNGKVEITLITCTKNKKKRLIVKCIAD